MLCRRLIREEARRRIAEDGDLNRREDLARVKGGAAMVVTNVLMELLRWGRKQHDYRYSKALRRVRS